jgi:peptidoglycan/LPS O-acetylase OafA/YrhL
MRDKTLLPALIKGHKLYFPALTGIRAIAAWLVFFHHFNPFAEHSMGWRVVREWYAGVAIFFVLSGFLICLRYIDRLDLSKAWLATYIRHRLARIYPLYLVAIGLTFALIRVKPQYDVSGLWGYYSRLDKLLVIGLEMAFSQGLFDQFKFTGIVPSWTLTVEVLFYAVAPLLLIGLKRQPSRLVGYAVGLLGIGCALVAQPFHRFGFFASYSFMLSITFFGHCIEFLAGMYTALLVLRPGKTTTSTLYTWFGLFWVAGVISTRVFVKTPSILSEERVMLLVFLDKIAFVLGVCSLFYGLVKEQTMLSRVLASKPFEAMGKASYAFYLIHLGILSQFLQLHVTQNVWLCFIITNLVALGLYQWVERPLYRLLAKRKKSSSRLVESFSTNKPRPSSAQ